MNSTDVKGYMDYVQGFVTLDEFACMNLDRINEWYSAAYEYMYEPNKGEIVQSFLLETLYTCANREAVWGNFSTTMRKWIEDVRQGDPFTSDREVIASIMVMLGFMKEATQSKLWYEMENDNENSD